MLEQVWRTTGRQPKQLAAHGEAPRDLIYLWNWYCDIKTDGCITYTEIQSWCALRGVWLTNLEIDVIRKLDQLHEKAIHDRCQSPTAQGR